MLTAQKIRWKLTLVGSSVQDEVFIRTLLRKPYILLTVICLELLLAVDWQENVSNRVGTEKSALVFVDKNTNKRKMLVRKRTSIPLEGYKE
jgi:hypothetical protein